MEKKRKWFVITIVTVLLVIFSLFRFTHGSYACGRINLNINWEVIGTWPLISSLVCVGFCKTSNICSIFGFFWAAIFTILVAVSIDSSKKCSLTH